MTDLSSLPVFGPERANCASCELKHQCAAGKHVGAHRPASWNGIVVVGEGPGVTEVSQGRPFVGASGRLLASIMESVGVVLDDCYITNATLCLPPRDGGDGAFMERFPGAVHACRARLFAELDAVRPRVVLALGATAFSALCGRESHRTRRVPQNCSRCDPADRKVGPVLACSVAGCGWSVPCAVEDGERLKKELGGVCVKCSASLKRIKPKRVKCPECGGTKTKEEPYTAFIVDWKLGEVAGGLFYAKDFGSGLEGHVEYVIPTYHPSFLLRAADSQSGSKKFGGQFAARAVQDHIAKAARLVHDDPVFELSVEITDDPARVREYTAGPGPYSVDIETNSEDGPFAVTQIRCVGIHDVTTKHALVLDTELCAQGLGDIGIGNELVNALGAFLADESKPKILQHGIYDRVTMALFWGITTRGQVADTELAHQALYPDEPHNLAHIAACLTDAEAWKPPKKKGGTLVFEDFAALAVYNARDLRVTADAAYRLGCDPRAPRGLLDQENVRAPYEQDMKLLDIAEEMELTGLPVDAAALAAIGDAARAEIKAALEKMATAFVKGVPVKDGAGVTYKRVADRCDVVLGGPRAPAEEDEDAPVQVGPGDGRAHIVLHNEGHEPYAWYPTVPAHLLWALFDKPGFLELPALVMTERTRKPSTSKEALIGHVAEPTGFVQALLDWRKYQKILSTYVEGDGLEVKPDGRIHASWNVARAVTGRWSTSPNLQNWPRDLRAAIVAPHGRAIVGADYCVVPGTRVLKADLSWVPVENLVLGDEVVAFPEALSSKQHTYRGARVVSVKRLRRPCVRITTDRGVVTCSVEHMWLARGASHPGRSKMVRSWTEAQNLRPGHTISFLGAPWVKDESREGGWMAGFLDGEGWVHSPGPGKGCTLGFGQKPGAVLDRALAYLRANGFTWAAHANAASGVVNVYVTGGAEHMRLLAMTQPTRLWAKHRSLWEGRRTWSKSQAPAIVQSVEFIGEHEVVAVGTTERTFVAEGFLSHNCQLELRILAALTGDEDLIYRCMNANEDRKLEPDHDPHSYVAGLTFGDTFTALSLADTTHRKTKPGEPKCKCETCKRKALREVIKRTVYGFAYGSSPPTVRDAIYNGGYEGPPITVAIIERVQYKFFGAFPKVNVWRNEQLERVNETWEVRSPILGRRRVFPLGQTEFTIAVNYPIQSGAADIVNAGTLRYYERLRDIDPTARVIAQVHDALYTDCAEDKAEAVAAWKTEALSVHLSLVEGAPAMAFLASAKVGKSWKEVS